MPPPPWWSPRRLTALAQRFEDRLTFPVVIAALASVPAVFLTIGHGDGYLIAGKILGWSAGAVLWVETVILLMAAENKREWLLRHKLPLVVCALTLLSLVIAAGGAQILRLFYLMGSVRLLRAKRIISASRVLERRLARRFEMNAWLRRALFGTMGLVAAAFVAVVLVDPTSEHLRLLSWFDENLRLIPIVVAGAILAVATWLVVRGRSEPGDPDEQ